MPAMTQTEASQALAELSGYPQLPLGEDTNRAVAELPTLASQYWQTILRWRLLIAGIVAVCLGAGVVLTLLQPALYTAQSQLEIAREQKNITTIQAVDQNGNNGNYEFYETQYALMRSRSLAERVARDLKLADDPGFFAAHGIKLPGADGKALSSAERKQRENMAAGLLLGGVRIAPVKDSSLVNVSYTSRSPQWSARIANAWPSGFIAATMDRQFSSSADARRFLEQRLATLRSKMDESENALIEFANARNIVKIGGGRDGQGRSEDPRTLVAANLEALNTALVQARTERIAAASRAQSRAGNDNTDAAQDAALNGLRARRAEYASEYARLLVQFDPGYPAAQAVKSQIDTIDAAIARETSRVRANRQASKQESYAEAVSRENELAAQVQALKAQFDQQQRDSVAYGIYQRDVETNRQLYDALLQRYKEIGVAGTVGATNIVVVDQAKVPGGPSSPNLMRNLGMALLIGVSLAALAVFVIEQADERLRQPSDVEKALQLPLLGNIPLVEGEPAERLADPKSGLSEAYFSVRTVLALATEQGLPRTMLVTSAQPDEGKSLTSLALAVSIGRTDQKVLLIDGDMRSPSVHKLTHRKNRRGLSNLLAGDEDYAAMIEASDMRGVSLLLAGPTPPSAAELLASDRLEQLLRRLREQFDCIIIDAPPLIGIADAPLLGRAVEGSVFVVQVEKVPLKTIRTALKRLKVGGNRVFGVVVTKIDFTQHRYGYGYAYGLGYETDYAYRDADKAVA